MPLTPQAIESLRGTIASDISRVRTELETLIRIPSIAFPGYPDAPVREAAAEVVRLLRDAGAADPVLLTTSTGSQAVYAEIPGPRGAPTVLLYAHYDVQPPGDEGAWLSEPFDPVVREGRLYGRGAADDKSGVVMHAAVLRAFNGAPPCTLRIVVEGDEEVGGTLDAYAREHPDLFHADAMVIADTGNLRIGEPTFSTTLRGFAEVYVEVQTLSGPMHSGMFGGPAPDAVMVLIRLLNSLWDADGNAAVAGVFGYEWDGADYPEDEYRDLAGLGADVPLTGSGSLSSRLFSQPVITVVGLDAPAVATAPNALPHIARAKVSMRVPPGVDSAKARDHLLAHLRANQPYGVTVTLTPGDNGDGLVVPTGGPAYDAARRALVAAYVQDVVEIGVGGSIPLVSVLHELVPHAELLLFGAQDPKAKIHAPNESVDLGELESAVLAQALFIAEYAEDAKHTESAEYAEHPKSKG